jgi:hypothetical protein
LRAFARLGQKVKHEELELVGSTKARAIAKQREILIRLFWLPEYLFAYQISKIFSTSGI